MQEISFKIPKSLTIGKTVFHKLCNDDSIMKGIILNIEYNVKESAVTYLVSFGAGTHIWCVEEELLDYNPSLI